MDYSVCSVSVFLGLAITITITFALWVWYPEIKRLVRLVSPKERRIRRGKAKLKRAQEAYDRSRDEQ